MKTLNINTKSLILAGLMLTSMSLFAQQPDLQYYRPWDQDGINQFEPSKTAEQP